MLKHKMCIVYMAMIDFAVVSSDKSRPVIWSLPSELNQRAGRLLDEAEAEESSDSIKGPKKDVSRGGHRRGLLGALFWQALRGLRKGNQGLAQAVLSQREELVTQIWDIV